MNSRSTGDFYKNALGAVLLLACAFFVCSTFLSMRAVFADPIAPAMINDAAKQASGRTSGRASPRDKGAAARPTTNSVANPTASRGVASRNVAARTDENKNISTRGVVARTATRQTSARSVAPRAVKTRTVRARTGTTTQRVGVTGDVIRGAKGTSSTYTYLSNKLYTGNYSNIIDSTTGLISADAYSTCLESYYTCMDEICTARSEAQRRCACAGRVKAFAEAESALESANEELIKISGELALLIANKGKEVSAAFSLTEAEKVMNCASWREASHNGTASESEFGSWCADHGLYKTSDCSRTQSPAYCSSSNNNGLFDIKDLDGAGSDILASLASWADEVKSNTDTILKTDEDSLVSAFTTITNAVSGITGSAIALSTDEVQDTLAETWGYDLFRYAHNNVCARVLDSCFNGIYEGCGTPPSGGRCANGASSSCPFNYNSKVTISSSGDVTLNERSNNSTNATASCFGYTSSSGDPYAALRGPVADARRSVMQKYLLDANADCDLYGEQLKTTAQKIAYQKVAAQQALQQKRLEFYNEEQEQILSDAVAAGTNFNECISELWDCYETQATSHTDWTTARIKTYCAQIANVPHCYQDMICNPSVAQFKAIIDVEDKQCTWHSSDYTINNCRNVVTLNEILSDRGTGTTPASTIPANNATGDSAALREKCLRDALDCPGEGCIRTWTK